jgi:Tfp pilus assembly protein PilF
MDLHQSRESSGRESSDRRLNSWKAIGAFFERDERTVRRWEIDRGLPVHRVPGSGRSSVYAYVDELNEWLLTADGQVSASEPNESPETAGHPAVVQTPPSTGPRTNSPSRRTYIFLLAAAILLLLAASPIVYRRYLSAHSAASPALPAGMKAAANPEAQEFYLQGLYYWNKRAPEDLNRGLDAFTQSVVHDPNYAPAYVGLANCYNLLREYTLMPPKEAYPRAIAAAQRAIALDDSLPEAHTALAFADMYWVWDARSADREFRRALALDPNSVVAHHWYGTALFVMGRYSEAIAQIDQAQQLDPPSSAILADKGLILFYAGERSQAVSLLRELEVSEPTFLSPHRYLREIALATGDYKSFLSESRQMAGLLRDSGRLEIAKSAEGGYAAAGGPGMLRAMLREAQRLQAEGKMSAFELAGIYALLKDRGQALRLLHLSVENHEAEAIAIRNEPSFQAMHGDPAFQKLVAKVGLPSLN